MSDDLVKRLRTFYLPPEDMTQADFMRLEAADRIEALTARPTGLDDDARSWLLSQSNHDNATVVQHAVHVLTVFYDQRDRLATLERSAAFYRNAADQQDMALAAKQERIAALEAALRDAESKICCGNETGAIDTIEAALNSEGTCEDYSQVAAIAAADQWLPIETAPTQKIILLFAVTDTTMDPPHWKMATGFWTPSGWWWDGRQLKDYDHQPTHWMPLPQPPEAT